MKTFFAALLLQAFILAALPAYTFAAKSVECTVTSVDETVITLDCGKKAKQLDVGAEVKLRAKKKKAIEGC